MIETVMEKIDRFSDNSKRHIRHVSSFSRTQEADLFARIIFTRMLDTFSKISANAPDDRIGSRKRFTDFIIGNSDWNDATRASLLHLDRALHLHSDPAFSGLCSWVAKRLSTILPDIPNPNSAVQHPESIERRITFDPMLDEVESHCPNNNAEQIRLNVGSAGSEAGLLPRNFTHAALLWQYRCHLVHEFRIPGRGWDVKGVGDPYYQSMAEGEISDELGWKVNDRRWELVYTLGFLCQLCDNSLEKLREQLRSEGRNPYQALKFGSYWLPALN